MFVQLLRTFQVVSRHKKCAKNVIHAFFYKHQQFFLSLGVAQVSPNLSLMCCLTVAYIVQELIKKYSDFRTIYLVPHSFMMEICCFAFRLCSLRQFLLKTIHVLVVYRHYFCFVQRKYKCIMKKCEGCKNEPEGVAQVLLNFWPNLRLCCL